jgi:hypothetical protein
VNFGKLDVYQIGRREFMKQMPRFDRPPVQGAMLGADNHH